MPTGVTYAFSYYVLEQQKEEETELTVSVWLMLQFVCSFMLSLFQF